MDVPISTETRAQATDAKAPFDSQDAEVIIRSSDNVDFRVFKILMSLASNVFKDMFALPQGPATVFDQETRDGLPVIVVTERSEIVEMLLKFCYPNLLSSVPGLKTMDEILPLLQVMDKYGIEKLESRLREALVTLPLVEERAISIFVAAYRRKWEKEMRIAATYILVQKDWEGLDVMELDSITGGDLLRLHRYRLKCAAAATHVATTFDWIPEMYASKLECPDCAECEGSQIVIFTSLDEQFECMVGGWWSSYMQNAGKELSIRPRGDTVLGSGLMDEAIRLLRASCCTGRCKRTSTERDFRQFCKRFASEVDRVVSEVSRLPVYTLALSKVIAYRSPWRFGFEAYQS